MNDYVKKCIIKVLDDGVISKYGLATRVMGYTSARIVYSILNDEGKRINPDKYDKLLNFLRECGWLV